MGSNQSSSFTQLIEVHDQNNATKPDLSARADMLSRRMDNLSRESAACQLKQREDEYCDVKARYTLAERFGDREALARLEPKMEEFRKLEQLAFDLPAASGDISDEEATSRARAILAHNALLPLPGDPRSPERGVTIAAGAFSEEQAQADALAILKDAGLM
jgi:hypothetical protein